MGLRQIGARTDSAPPFVLGACQVSHLVKGNSQVIVRNSVVGVVLQRIFQRVDGVIHVPVADLNLAAVNQGFGIVGVGFQYFVIQLAGLIPAVFQNEQLDVVLLRLQVVRVILVNRGIFGSGFVQVPGGEVEIAQHAVSHRVVGQIPLDLF